jgi:hypothetical protein
VTREEKVQALATLIADAESMKVEAQVLADNVWEFGEDMVACEGVTGSLIVAADNLADYLEDRKRELGL